MRAATLSFLLLFSYSLADTCPKGYSQAPNGGDCYQIRTYFDSFIGEFKRATFYSAELDCNNQGGGMLASIHSQEEHEFVQTLVESVNCGQGGEWYHGNVGLRCIGKECAWDDGSPVTYTNFEKGMEPSDDGKSRCYGLHEQIRDTCWSWQKCEDQYTGQCWVCSVKSKTIECEDGETEYKGGCISVHTSPLDQKSAEASCLGGGHLASIHGSNDNGFYTQLALYAGVTGTVYIGGQYSNGVFEWIDGSFQNTNFWAAGFPNTVFGTCVQLLLASEFGVQGQWTNIDCTVKQPYICFRNGGVYGPTAFPPHPKADAHCPPIQYYTGSGTIYSPNYPLSIPNQQTCEYVLGAKEGTKASVKFTVFNSQSGTTLSLYDGLNSDQPFLTFTSSAPSLNHLYTVSTNVMKIVFSANGPSAPTGTGWEAEFSSL